MAPSAATPCSPCSRPKWPGSAIASISPSATMRTAGHATQDAGVAERAFRIAEYLGADQAALDTALIWAKNAPDNLDAQRAAAVQLARGGRYDESMTYMEKVLQGQGDTHFDFLALSAAETDPDTRAGLLQSFDRLLAKYPDNSQLVFGRPCCCNRTAAPKKPSHCWRTSLPTTSRSRRSCCARAAEPRPHRRSPAPAAEGHQAAPGRQAPAPDLRPPAGGREPPGRGQVRVRRPGAAVPR